MIVNHRDTMLKTLPFPNTNVSAAYADACPLKISGIG
jgi:hypothetical protein